MASTARVTITNDKNNGTDSETHVTIPTDGTLREIGTLTLEPKPSTFPQILATNITFNAQNIEVTFQVGSKNIVPIKSGQYQNISPDGKAVNVAPFYLSAKKV